MIDVRRIFTHVESIAHEFGPPPDEPLLRGAIGIVMNNPYAGRYVSDIMPMMDALGKIGLEMAERLRFAMDVPANRIEGYGKGAIVGANGELEHGAMWHVPGGYAMRELLGWKGDRYAYSQGKATHASSAISTTLSTTLSTPINNGINKLESQTANALAIVPSTKKVGAPGTALDVPLTHINASYVRSHFDAIEVRVPGAPAADEIVFILAMSTGARVHARVGGLAASAISKWDGLR